MKTYTFSKNDNTATFYITEDGDIIDSLADAAPDERVVAEVVVDEFFVGSLDEMRANALRMYHKATQ